MAKNIKEIHEDFVICYKVGAFYHCYGKDAYIVSFLFGYNLTTKNSMATCGFPERALLKVMAKLENKNINYMTIDTRNNYDVDNKEDYKNLNTYTHFFDKAYEYIRLKRRIEKICESLIFEINETKNIKEKIKIIEEIVYEDREV